MRVSLHDFPRRSLLLPLAAGLVPALIACTGPAESPAAPPAESGSTTAQPDERGVIAAHQALIDALEAGDVTSATALMDPSPELLIFHPFVENRFDSIEEVDQGLRRMLASTGSLSWTEAHRTLSMEGNVAWLTAQVILRAEAFPEPFLGRGTEIWVHGPGGWRLKHAHWSGHAPLEGMPGGS